MYAVVVIGADGATDIIGPCSSESRARKIAESIANEDEGVAADVYMMDSPRNYREYITAGEQK